VVVEVEEVVTLGVPFVVIEEQASRLTLGNEVEWRGSASKPEASPSDNNDVFDRVRLVKAIGSLRKKASAKLDFFGGAVVVEVGGSSSRFAFRCRGKSIIVEESKQETSKDRRSGI
jgi:hypothetical protein